MKKHLAKQALLLLSVFTLSKGYANQLTVCNSSCDYSTISSAVAAAGNGDTILLKGQITEAGITISKNLTFIGEAMASTIVQGSEVRGTAVHRVFYITNGANVTFRDLTVQHGREGMPDPANAGAAGGAFLIDGSGTTLTLVNVTVKNNDNAISGGAGGAIGLFGSATNLNVYNCRVEGNTSLGSAGAFYLTATNGAVTAKNTVFDNNTAGGGSGGAIFLGSTILSSFANCTFCNNTASGTGNGGAVYGNGVAPEFTNCTFNNNTATNQGGALRIGPATLTNCTFFQNRASGQGGAIYRGGISGGTLSIVNCTIYNNTGETGGGLCYNTSTGAINLVNSVLAANTGSDLFASNSSNLGVNQKNYVAGNSFAAGSADFDYTSGALNISSALVPNGGLTPTLAVGAGSVLINSGVSSVSDVTVLQKDQRNFDRAGIVDIGAYETSGSEGVSISYMPLANTSSVASRSLRTTISDETNGIPTSGSYVPQIYYKKNNGSWYNSAGTLSSGNSTSGTWDFTINYAYLGGVTSGDVISYFITAQDNATGSYAKSNLSGLVAADVLTVSTVPNTPETYTISGATLPIRLLRFAASRQGNNDALVSWDVSEDPDAESYEVLRSSNVANLQTVATLAAKGLSSYSFTDRNQAGTVYYQLKMLTDDGKARYSQVVSVSFGRNAAVQLLPNFVTAGRATLAITAPSAGKAEYILVDVAGRQVQRKQLALTTGSNSFTLPLEALGNGQYFLQVQLEPGKVQTLPLIKQ
ncbi:T9SS type A sorting domain-containing protein [Flavisolibacter nicotianae]|uniref:T9SS type A sorting domain-containing protein n=1 Tax=Flavisolibacter nicotianae TaxID=2364882 RepID=UPI000EB15117|nr:T9SS type A sorting domain-containing protein [Flavisolibacter nicotianae]